MGPAVRRTSASSRSGSYGSEAMRRMLGGETMAGTPARSRYAGGSAGSATAASDQSDLDGFISSSLFM